MKKIISIPLILLVLTSCGIFDSGDDLQEEAEAVLPSSTWYASDGNDGYETWNFGADGNGTFSQHTLPCGSDPTNSYEMSYEILDGPDLSVELSVDGETQTDTYDIQGVSEEEVVLLNQQENLITNLHIECESL